MAVRDAVEKAAGFVGLADGFARIEGMQSSAYSADSWMQKAVRAEQAGFDEQIGAMYRQQAQLARNQAVRQGRAAIAAIDERIGRADWSTLVETLSQEFINHDGQRALDDAREKMRFQLVDLNGMPSENVVPIIRQVAITFDRPSGGGLNEAIADLREHVDRQVERLAAPPQDRKLEAAAAELRDPQVDAECASIATGVCLALMIICACIPWCWCCAWAAIVLGWLISLCVCYGINCAFILNGDNIIQTGP